MTENVVHPVGLTLWICNHTEFQNAGVGVMWAVLRHGTPSSHVVRYVISTSALLPDINIDIHNLHSPLSIVGSPITAALEFFTVRVQQEVYNSTAADHHSKFDTCIHDGTFPMQVPARLFHVPNTKQVAVNCWRLHHARTLTALQCWLVVAPIRF